MGGGDQQKRPRSTKRFTRAELAELADKARGDRPPVEEPAAGSAQPEVTPMSRSMTLHDPMTTQLLAEVARRLQTMELEVPEGALEGETEADSVHPNLLRRRQP